MLNLPEHGYTPNNYKALVGLTGLTNAQFYRQFDVPEQTFYSHYLGRRTMKWRDWNSLLNQVVDYLAIDYLAISLQLTDK